MDIIEKLTQFYIWAKTPEGIKTLEVLAPLVVAFLGYVFKLSNEKKTRVAHAINRAVKLLKAGDINVLTAANHILATGVVKDSVATKIAEAIDGGKELKITPVKGVSVGIDTSGKISISGAGLADKAVYKIGKYFKKKLRKG